MEGSGRSATVIVQVGSSAGKEHSNNQDDQVFAISPEKLGEISLDVGFEIECTKRKEAEALGQYDPSFSLENEFLDAKSLKDFSNEDFLGLRYLDGLKEPLTRYPQRWYIAILFGIQLGVAGGIIWNTWGPISDSAGLVFGWSDAEIALLPNWGLFSFLLATPLFAWLLDVKGLRWATVISCMACTIGSGLRIITASNPAATWLINVGQFVNGIGLPMVIAAPAVVSATWFPAEQRTTATATIVTLNVLGMCISFIMGPLIVPDRLSNVTMSEITRFQVANTIETPVIENLEVIEEIRNDIMNLLYIQFVMAAVLFNLVLIYFPAKPPTPPTTTAGTERVDIKPALKQLMANVTFHKLNIAYGLSQGVYITWLSVLHVNVKQFGVSEVDAGLAGFFTVFIGCISNLITGAFADVFRKRMKLFMITLYVIASVVFIIFSMATQGLIPFSLELMYVCMIIGGIALYGVLSLFYELCCESTYPVAEGITNSTLSVGCNVFGLLFLAMLNVPGIGTEWMNWAMTACIVVCIPILYTVKEQYNRLDVDTSSSSSPTPCNASDTSSTNTADPLSTRF